MRTITLQQLRDAKACADQRALFAETFPSGETPPITPELCEQYAGTFDFKWAGAYLLSAAAQAEFERTTAPAWAEYRRACAAAQAERDRTTAAARVERDRTTKRVREAAQAEYARACAAAWAEYDRACAAAFGKLYAAGG